jgi:hypothetical protein
MYEPIEEPEISQSHTEISTSSSSGTPAVIRWIGIASGCLIVFVLAMVAYVHEHSVNSRLSSENSQLAGMLKDTRGQVDALNSKLDALVTAQQQQAAQEKAKSSLVQQTASRNAHRRAAVQNSQFKKFQAQLDAQGKAIESTQQDLASTRTDLQGSIAKTHDELVVLQKKGQRNYFEFDLDKAKQFQHAGPIGISLRKANTKHQYADLELMVEDAQLSKKHVNLYEPVRFYPGEDQQSVELVINSIRKNHIHGYLSMPKYSSKELVAAGEPVPDASSAAPTTAAPKSRTKLAIPQ